MSTPADDDKPEIEVVEDFDSAEWDSFVSGHELGHHVQSTHWARFQQSRGWEPVRVVARQNGALVGLAQMLIKKVGGLVGIGYLDGAPLTNGDAGQMADMIVAVQAEVRRRSIRMVLVQPPSEGSMRQMLASGFGETNLRVALTATVVVDLTRSPDEILAAMKSKTRYNIRKGLKSTLEVRSGNRDDIAAFQRMLAETASRQGFATNSLDYFLHMFDALDPAGLFKLFIAEDGEGPVSAILLVAFGSTVVYKRGAWSGRAGNQHPNELLHWTAMLWAKEQGFSRYDFDGIEPEVAAAVIAGSSIPTESVRTVTRFKLGFGGEVVMLPGSLAYVPNPILRFGRRHILQRLGGTRPVKWLIKRIQTQ